MKHILRFILFLSCFYVFSFADTKPLAPNSAYNGTVFIYQSDEALPLTYDKKSIRYTSHPKNPNAKIAFVPVGYYEKNAKILKSKGKDYFTIKILQKDYPKETITVAPDKVSYSNEVAQRIEKEKNDIVKVYHTYTKGRLWDKPFIKPLDSVITSPYGSARVFNNTIKSYHGGTDFRAVTGTPIKASNDGIVALVQDRYLSGKSIVINHGEGLHSVYFHLDSFDVKVGDKVKQGQVIAKSGGTGRVSGPHLHFGIVINGTNVDSLDFVQQTQNLFK